MEINNLPTLYVMVGLPGSGKSHIAVDLAKENEAVIFSMDNIREELCGRVEDQSRNKEVFEIYRQRIRNALKEGKNVIADATNVSHRSSFLHEFADIPHKNIAHVANKDINDCLIDNLDRPHPVPPDVIKRMAERFTVPTKAEGFEDIIVHNYERDMEKEM